MARFGTIVATVAVTAKLAAGVFAVTDNTTP